MVSIMFTILLITFGFLGIGAAVSEIVSLRRTLAKRESDHRLDLTRIEARRDAVAENYEKEIAGLKTQLSAANEQVEIQRTAALTAQRNERQAESSYEKADLIQSVKLEEAEKRADKAEEYAKNVQAAYESASERRTRFADEKSRQVLKAKSGSELRALNDSANEKLIDEEIRKHDHTSAR